MILVQIPLEEIWQAYCHVSAYYTHGASYDVLKTTIFSYKINQNLTKPFDIHSFYQTLSCYLYGQPDPWYEISSSVSRSNIVYGIAYYNDLINLLEDDNRCLSLPYKCLYDLRIHKQFLTERLKYVCSIMGDDNDFIVLVKQYEIVEKLYERMNLLNLKYNCECGCYPHSFSTNPEFRRKLLLLLKQAYNLEVDVVYRIVAYLDCFLSTYTPIQIDDFTVKKIDGGLVLKPFVSDYLCGLQVSVGQSIDMNKSVLLQLSNGWVYWLNESNTVNTYSFRPTKVEWMKITNCNSLRLFRVIRMNNERSSVLSAYTLEHWKPLNHIDNWIIHNEKATFDISGIDPYLICEGENFDAMRYPYITIEYKTNDDSDKAQLYFMTESTPAYSLDKAVTFSISPSREKQSYKLDMSGLATWSGIVTLMRLDPVHYYAESIRESGYSQCTIYKILVSSDPHVYTNTADFSGVQGVNNWNYCSKANGVFSDLLFDTHSQKWNDMSGNVFIDTDCQAGSRDTFAIRQWKCPADGSYKINVSFECDIGMDFYLYIDNSQAEFQNDNRGCFWYQKTIDIKKDSFIQFVTGHGYVRRICIEIKKVI